MERIALMKELNYQTLKEQNYNGYLLEYAPERILQFGEGNFLRAFVDYFVDIMNEKANFQSKIVICQPIPSGLSSTINKQEGLYTLFLRGIQDGRRVNEKRVISCVSRCINPFDEFEALLACADNPELRFVTSNTTEAGIVYDKSCKPSDTPCKSFPGKLTQLLYRRYQRFGTVTGKGFIILPCELIDDNGNKLKECVLKHGEDWDLGESFKQWIEKENHFCSTLVDRIVTGYPQNEASEMSFQLNYKDQLMNTSEVFGLWVIEAPSFIKKEFPAKEANLPVVITDDHKPYKKRKVRILNGAHTSFALGAYLAGQNIVRDCMNDPVICKFMNDTIYEEIIPTLNLPKDELDSFAVSVTERFKNPYIDHELLSISLNSTSKWRARILPTLKEYYSKYNTLPRRIVASFAFYIEFYNGTTIDENGLEAHRNGNIYFVKDEPTVLKFFAEHNSLATEVLVKSVCQNQQFWGEDLSLINGFVEQITQYLTIIKNKGAYQLMKMF